MAPIRMTRAEYEAKYGAPPTPRASSPAPVKMTRAEYETKYGMSPSNQQPVIAKPKTFLSKVDQFATTPTFKANTDGSMISNVAKTIGNIPSSAARLAKGAVVSPFVSAFNVVKDVGGSVKEKGFMGTAKDIASGFNTLVNETAGKAYTGAQNFAKDFNNDPTGTLGKGIEKIAKVGIEDPLFVPSLFYGGKKVGITGDVVQSTARPVIKEATALASEATALASDITKLSKVEKLAPNVLKKDVTALRSEKITEGLMEQNNRLKTVGNSFNENTIQRKLPDGSVSIVTPAQTFAKYNITPKVEKGSINMGDWVTGQGELGKMKNLIEESDASITSLLKEKGKPVSLESFENNAIKRAMSDEMLRREGTVESTIQKIKNQVADYKRSYGDSIDTVEINEIRKVQNRRFDPETMDSRRIIGDISRDVVYNATDDQIVKKMLQEQGEILAARNYANKLNGTKVQGGKLTTMALRATGAIIGSTLDKFPVVGPLAGALGGEALGRGLQQAQFRSLPTEIKALFQRSNKNQQINKAITTPSTGVISSNNTKFVPKSKTLAAVLNYIKNPKLGLSVKRLKMTPDDADALQKISRAFKQQSEALKTKSGSIDAPARSGYERVEQDILEHFGIPVSGKSLGSIAKKIDIVVERYLNKVNKK